MYEAVFRNKFTNEIVFYVFLVLLLVSTPFFFIWELIITTRSCFSCVEDMSKKVVLITGASSVLDYSMAYEYAKRGAFLAVVAIEESESRLELVANTARELGSPDVLFVFADVSNVDECRMFVDDTIKRFGRLDHLICNAGIGPAYSIVIDVNKFAPVMDINFWGSIYPTHFVIPYLMKTNGRIIVNASSAGVLNVPKGGLYNASKAALISFYESLRFEVAPKIEITILTLGFIKTNIITAKYSTKGVGVHLTKDFGAFFPVMEAEPCAKSIVDNVCKGAASITEPRFFKVLFLIKFLFPHFHHFYLSKYSTAIFSRPKS